MNEYQRKLRSLSFTARPTRSKVTEDRTDTAVVTTTEQAERQDVNVRMNEPIHWEAPCPE